MKDIWNRLEAWLEANAQEVLHGLNPPATREQIATAEAELGISFPPDVVETFLIHNGQVFNSPWLLDGWEFMSLERVVDEWGVWKGLLDGGDFDGEGISSNSDGHTVTDWWHPRWIPLTYDGAGDHHCLDLAPGPLGKVGQIIQMWHDDDSRPLIAPSYREWLSRLVSDFEAGHYAMSAEYGGIVKRGA